MTVSKQSQEGANVVEVGPIGEALFPLLSQGSRAGWGRRSWSWHGMHLILKSGPRQTAGDLESPLKSFIIVPGCIDLLIKEESSEIKDLGRSGTKQGDEAGPRCVCC